MFAPLTFALETDFAVSIVEDMVAARAFVGSGRSFEFYGSEGEMRNMVELENKGYVQRAADSDGTASESRWYLTRKVASLLEAYWPERCKFHMCFHTCQVGEGSRDLNQSFFAPSFLPLIPSFLCSSSSSFLPPPPNRELQISVGTAGPQLQAPDLSWALPRRAPDLPDLNASCRSQRALPDLKR